MKITFLVSGNIRSNFSYRALSLARSMRRLGHEVSIIAPKADKYNNFVAEHIDNIDGIKIVQPFQFTTRKLEINLFPYLFSATIALFIEKPDLVYIYKSTPISIVGLFSKFFRKTRIIVDYDDLGSEVMRIEGHPWYERLLVSWSEWLAGLFADRIVVVSSYLFNIYRKKFSPTPVHLMPNGVESDWFNEPTKNKNSKRIVFMGSLNRTNILDPLFKVLPEIVKLHPDLEVLIMGDGKYLSYFKELSKELGISKSITFTGWLTIDKVKDRLWLGDIGYNYMPEDQTTLAASNMKVPQYMSRGVLPLVSDIGDLPATVDGGNAGYVAKSDDIQSLKKTIIFALSDTSRIDKAKHAIKFSFKTLNWDALAENFNNWLKPKPEKPKTRKKHLPYITQAEPMYFLIGLIILDVVAVFNFDPLYIGAFLAFIYMMVTPGFLMLSIVTTKKFSWPLGVVFSVGLSVLILMLLGLAVNTFLPMFGIDQPLATTPLLFAFNFVIYLLLIFNYKTKKSSAFEIHEFNLLSWVVLMFSFVMPILACLGAILLNNHGSNFPEMIVLAIAFLIIPTVVIWKDKLSPSIPPVVLYMTALAFLLMNSMRGWFITGHDILLEYHVFVLTNNAHRWSMAFYQDPYNACLSLTILPTYIESFIHVVDSYIFKFFTQFIGALPVVLVYYVTKQYVSDKLAFLAGFLYIAFPTFMVDMAFLNRQGIAFVFFGSLLFVMFNAEHFSGRIRTLLLFLFGTGMILSHYSTSYIAVPVLVCAYFINRIVRYIINSKRPRWLLRLTNKLGNKEMYSKPILLTFPLVIGLLAIMLVWSSVITKTSSSLFNTIQQIAISLKEPFSIDGYSGPAKYSLVQSKVATPQELYSKFLENGEERNKVIQNQSQFYSPEITDKYTTTPVAEDLLPLTTFGLKLQSWVHFSLIDFFAFIKQAYAKIIQIIMIIGLFGLILGYGFKKHLSRHVPIEYIAISISGIMVMVGQTILPASAIEYGLLRLFQQNLMFLALPIMLGLVWFVSLFVRSHKKQLIIVTGILMFFFVILSGLFPQLTGGIRAPLGLNNSGLYYYSYYTHAQEVSAIKWIDDYVDSGVPVQAAHFSDIKMISYGFIAPRIELLPETTRKQSYVYLNYENVKTGNIIESVNGDILYYHFPVNFLDENKSLIYNNGGSRVYR